MSELPKGWVEGELNYVCDLITDGTHHSPSNGQIGEFKYVTAKNIKRHGLDLTNISFVDRETHQTIYKRCPVRKGDVLYIKDGATTGLAIVNPLSEEFSMLSSVALIRPAELLDAHFLKCQLNSPELFARMTGDMTGSAIRRLTLTTIGRQKVCVPPLAEQKRIVAKLDALSARSTRARDALARIDTLVKRYKQAVLSKAFLGELTKETHVDRASIGDVAAKVTKGTSPKWQGFEYQNEGVRFIRSQNIGWGHLRLEDEAFLAPEFNLKQTNSVIEENDVLLNIVGASIGRTTVASESISGANCNQAVSVIKLARRDPVSANYLCWWLQTDEAQAAITAGAVDVARANFSLAQIKKLSLPWPPVSKQKEIVRRIESAFAKIDRLAAEAKRALALTDRLDEAILAKAFRGELVPQDPADEPASVLLERIRAERAAAPRAKRGRRATA
ncbi:restriction endonuclease subunit S [Stappia sp.]|uniref:restriction endonuclease subunit S n=1 Tax=Stappia sp. TaxID=1870903 RepID=UPI003A99F552